MKRTMLTFLLAGLITLVVSSVVAAKSDNANGPKGEPGAKGKCARACKAERRDCTSAQKDARSVCVEAKCASLHDAVVAACGEDDGLEESPECTAAKHALRDCVRLCGNAYRTGNRQCKNARRACLTEECGASGGNGPCVANCMQERRACLLEPRDARHTCLAECQHVQSAAAVDCGTDESPECLAAENAMKECTIPCREAFQAAKATCREANDQCLANDCDLVRGKPKIEAESAD